MRLGPNHVAIFVARNGSDQRLELLARPVERGAVGRSRAGLSPPRGVGKSKLDPTPPGVVEIQLGGTLVLLTGEAVGTLVVVALGQVSDLLVACGLHRPGKASRAFARRKGGSEQGDDTEKR